MEMESRGNEVTYKHPMYFTTDNPNIQIAEDKFINILPIETVDTGGSIYGLYELICSNKPCDPIGKRLITTTCITGKPSIIETTQKKTNLITRDNPLPALNNPLPTIDKVESINADIQEIPQTPGIYHVPTINQGKVLIKVEEKTVAGTPTSLYSIFTTTTKNWVAFKMDTINNIMRSITINVMKHKNLRHDSAELIDLLKRSVATQLTSSNINTDAIPDFLNIVLKKTIMLLKTMHEQINNTSVEELLIANGAPESWWQWIKRKCGNPLQNRMIKWPLVVLIVILANISFGLENHG
jgi:hypothetical protein